MILFARGINIGLNTRVYFSDEAKANAEEAKDSLLTAMQDLGNTQREINL